MSMSPSGSRCLYRTLATTLLLAALTAGCASSYAMRVPSADEIPRLEARAEQAPRDGENLILLGAAYRGAGRLDDARATLERATEIAPGSADAAFLLGLTYEDLERYAAARGLYQRYLQLNPTGPLTARVEDRIVLLRQKEIQQSVRQAVAQEREIAQTPPDPTTIAVFPFLFRGGSDDLAPLGMAMSGMIATDLSQSGRLTVLERANIQTLMDEMALSRTGLVDEQTAARSGRILGAGRIVQGQVEGTEQDFGLDAAVIEVGRAGAQAETVQARDALDRLFDLQKQLVMGIFDAMGVTLTAAERERVTERRTENLEALLAYGRGVEASFQGDAAEAARQFSRASELDPGFSAAASEAQEADAVATASGTATDELVQQAEDVTAEAAEMEREVVEAVDRAADWNPQRDNPVVGEGGGMVGTTTRVRIIIRRPSGGGR